jgi:hypothetical protein
MHAVVTNVTIRDPEAAAAFARDEIAPGVSQAPGFVTGHWVQHGDSKGTSVTVFDSEDAASQVADQVRGYPPHEAVTIDSVDVGPVVANA